MAKKGIDLKNGIMHVGIPEPIIVRKSILNSAIVTIQLLKRFEIHKKILKEKELYREQFIKYLKEARTLIKDSIAILPPAPPISIIPKEKRPVKPAIKPKIIKEIEKKLPKIEKTHIDKLEDDIDNLRDLISDL